MATALRYTAYQPLSGEADFSCVGPAPDGACPRVALGTPVACAGHALVVEGADDPDPYVVPGSMTLCPVTLAQSLGARSGLVPW